MAKKKIQTGPTKEELRLAELNNFDHELVTEDFSDSPFADRVEETNDEDY
jgi:hypothetical protein